MNSSVVSCKGDESPVTVVVDIVVAVILNIPASSVIVSMFSILLVLVSAGGDPRVVVLHSISVTGLKQLRSVSMPFSNFSKQGAMFNWKFSWC